MPRSAKVAGFRQNGVADGPEFAVEHMRQRQIGVSKAEGRIPDDRRFEKCGRFFQFALRRIAQQSDAAQHQFMGGEAGYRLPRGTLQAGIVHPNHQPADDLFDDLLLDGGQAGVIGLVAIPPELGSAGCVNEIDRTDDAVCLPPHRTLDEIVGADARAYDRPFAGRI
ncbi:hypothetical protein NKG60_06500 [Mesorhizobium sp. M1428]|uniref:hypothetical protein n=1 Tax=Mesorhizobium sp. M1428 TaxID=2957102 RepID=UPI00333CD00D